jgi:hypothetical protein
MTVRFHDFSYTALICHNTDFRIPDRVYLTAFHARNKPSGGTSSQ